MSKIPELNPSNPYIRGISELESSLSSSDGVSIPIEVGVLDHSGDGPPLAVTTHNFSHIQPNDPLAEGVSHSVGGVLAVRSQGADIVQRVCSAFRSFIHYMFQSEIRDIKATADFFVQGWHALAGDSTYLSKISVQNPQLKADFTLNGEVVGSETVDRKDAVGMVRQQAVVKLLELESLVVPGMLKDFRELKLRLSSVDKKTKDLQNEPEKYEEINSKIERDNNRILEILQKYPGFNLESIDNAIDAQTAIQAKIAKCVSTIAECNRRNVAEEPNWLGSSDFRDLLEKAVELNPNRNAALNDTQATLDAAVQAFTRLMQQNIPAAINFRNHNAESGGYAVNLVRLGGMTDSSNSYVHLGELKEMVGDDNKRSAKLQELQKKLDTELGKNGVSRKAIVLKYACNQLSSPDSVKVAVAERRLHLQQQFLQVVQQHVENTGGADSLGSILPMVHLSLLNQYTNGDHASGWHKDEGNIMRDMDEIFREMRETTIVFDGEGPYIGEDNVIHLGKCEVAGKPKEVELKAVFFNISVQGSTVNNADQQKINNESMQELQKIVVETSFRIANVLKNNNELQADTRRDYGELLDNLIGLGEKLGSIQARLNAGESSYDLACALQDAVNESRFLRYSVNCLSAKDRTGIMCARGALGHVMHRMPVHAEAIRKENGWKMFDFFRPAMEVARECGKVAINRAEVLSLKSPAFNVPDYTFVDWKGPARRVYELILTGVMFVQPLARLYYFARHYDGSPPAA